MEAPNLNAYLTLEQLCDEVNDLWRGYRWGAKDKKVTGRTVRFYVGEDLLPAVRPGPGKKYPYETVWRVLFIRVLRKKHKVTLEYLRGAMQSVDVETMRRVVTGEEPLEVRTTPDAGAVKRHKSQGYQVVALTGAPQHTGSSKHWEVLAQTQDAVLQVRDGVAPAKLKQLRHIAALIRALDEDQ